MKQRISTIVGTLVIIIMALTAGAFVFKVDKFDMQNLYQPTMTKIKNKPNQTVCTMEAKLCSDGTYVSRSGPNCEFAVCPGESDVDTSNWQTYRNEKYGYEIKFPAGWKTDQQRPADVSLYNLENSKNDYWFSINLIPNLNKSLADWPGSTILLTKKEIKRDVSVVGVEAIKTVDFPSTQAPGHICYNFIRNNTGFELCTLYIGESNDIGEKIISTLKFNDETADSHTYVSAKYGFEFRYPQSYVVQDIKDGVVFINSSTREESSGLVIQINQDSSLKNLDLDAIIQSKLKSLSIKEPQKTMLADQAAYEGNDLGMVTSYEILTKKGNNFYELVFNSRNKDTFAANKAALDANQKLMLSTFKFTVDTADWQTYRNEKYGYSIKIPIEATSGKMKILEDGDITFITAEKDMQYKKILNNIKSSKNDYEKTWGITWALLAKKVSNDSEIDVFIKKSFGNKCNLGEKVASKQAGVFDVRIDLSNWDPENGCFVNYAHAIKYSSEKNVIVTWDYGQAVNFDLLNGDAADPEMGESFQFVN